MRWKELYKKCNHNVNTIVNRIDQPVKLKSNVNNFINKYKWILLFGVIAFTVAVLAAFKFNIQLILASYGIMLILLILMIYYNTYKIEINKDIMNLDISMRQHSIKIEDVVNIYIERKRSFILLFIPYYDYFINILFLENEQIKGFSLSTIMVKKSEIKKFFDHFEFKNIEELNNH